MLSATGRSMPSSWRTGGRGACRRCYGLMLGTTLQRPEPLSPRPGSRPPALLFKDFIFHLSGESVRGNTRRGVAEGQTDSPLRSSIPGFGTMTRAKGRCPTDRATQGPLFCTLHTRVPMLYRRRGHGNRSAFRQASAFPLLTVTTPRCPAYINTP